MDCTRQVQVASERLRGRMDAEVVLYEEEQEVLELFQRFSTRDIHDVGANYFLCSF